VGYTQTIGRSAEDLACRYLQEHGLSVIQRNYRTRYGEIDLIMRDRDATVFVEVRFRAKSHLVDPLSSIDSHKQQKLVRTASAWLQKHTDAGSAAARFDVIAISGQDAQRRIDWIKNAFEARSV
jgi:putative endonuclease